MSKIDLITPEIYELASDVIKERIDLARETSIGKAARDLGFDERNFRRALDRLMVKAKKKGIIPGLTRMIVG